MPPTPPDIPPVPPPEPRPPRPPNSWILFRAYMMKQIRDAEDPKATRLTQTQISIIIANMWKTADDATRAEFERRAEEAKAAHRLKHPNYRYRPRKKEDKERERQANQLKRELKRLEKSWRAIDCYGNDSLNFNVAVDPEYQRDMQTLVHYDADLLASYNDLFILSNIGEFNPEALIEVHMAVGGYQEHESAANFMSTSQVPFSPFHSEAGSLPHMEAPGPDFYRQFDPVLNISAPSEQAAYGMHQEDAFQANYQYPFASEEDSLSTLLPHAEVSQSTYTPIAEHLVDFDLPNQSTAYNPPAGASHSSNRRVAGDWTTHFLKTTASPRISS
ncbi:hypothetical protein D9613_000570 [Agrocybe pediades]|uniref:HMG box domain-containing protein n=1 Tax=Agrocybe pediades TaxID=84607 RepID=A0A8H4R1R9_9AGAR|nr:hypothetical protein D9613_000570 [Agrocybe pediades]